MNFGMIILNQSMRMQNYATWIKAALLKLKDVYEDIPDDLEKIFNTSNNEVNRTLSTGNNKKETWLMRDKLGGKIITEFLAFRRKT